jgi:hypothetical protein
LTFCPALSKLFYTQCRLQRCAGLFPVSRGRGGMIDKTASGFTQHRGERQQARCSCWLAFVESECTQVIKDLRHSTFVTDFVGDNQSFAIVVSSFFPRSLLLNDFAQQIQRLCNHPVFFQLASDR